MTAPTAIQIELGRICDSLEEKEEVDVEVLSIKTRLNRLENDLKNYEIWKRHNYEDYVTIENVISKLHAKIKYLTNKNTIKTIDDNINNMQVDINQALEDVKLDRLKTLEKFVINNIKDLEALNNEVDNESLKEEISNCMLRVEVLKKQLHDFYLSCLDAVENTLVLFSDVIAKCTFSRYEINFTKVHNLIELALQRLRNVEVQDHKSSISSQKRQLVTRLEEIRQEFNDKIFANEAISNEANLDLGDGVLSSIQDIEKLLAL